MSEQRAVNQIFRTNLTTETAPLRRKVADLDDVVTAVGLDPSTEQEVLRLVGETNVDFSPKTAVHRMTIARDRLVSTLRTMPQVNPEQRMEITKRAIAYWTHSTATGYNKEPSIRWQKSEEPTLVVQKALYVGPRGGKWADPQHTIPWKGPETKKRRVKKKKPDPFSGKITAETVKQWRSDFRKLTKQYRTLLETTDWEDRSYYAEVGSAEYQEVEQKYSDWEREFHATRERFNTFERNLSKWALSHLLRPRVHRQDKEVMFAAFHNMFDYRLFPAAHQVRDDEGNWIGQVVAHPKFMRQAKPETALRATQKRLNEALKLCERYIAQHGGELEAPSRPYDTFHRGGVNFIVHYRNNDPDLEAATRHTIDHIDSVKHKLDRLGLGAALEGLNVDIHNTYVDDVWDDKMGRFAMASREIDAVFVAGFYQPPQDRIRLFPLGNLPGHETFVHEVGHRVYFQLLGDKGREAWAEWRNNRDDPSEFVSDYAETNEKELFAEAFKDYVLKGPGSVPMEIRANLENSLRAAGLPLRKSEEPTLIAKGGPYMGPRGGKWADPKLTIPFKGELSAPKINVKKLLAGNFGIPRVQMPQIRSDLVPEFIEGLRAKGLQVERVETAVGDLRATQNELSAQKIERFIEHPRLRRNLAKPVITSKDGYLLDGHHRWAAMRSIDDTAKIQTVRVGLPMQELLAAAMKFEKVEFKKGCPTGGSAPLFVAQGKHTPTIERGPGPTPILSAPKLPDFQTIYAHPETRKEKKEKRKEGETRRQATAEKNTGKFGFHGARYDHEPKIRWNKLKDPIAHIRVREPNRPGKEDPMESPKLAVRREAEKKKKKKQAKLVVAKQ